MQDSAIVRRNAKERAISFEVNNRFFARSTMHEMVDSGTYKIEGRTIIASAGDPGEIITLTDTELVLRVPGAVVLYLIKYVVTTVKRQ